MNQDRAVKKMLLERKVQKDLPERYFPLFKECLTKMWVVGFDAKERIPRPTRRVPVTITDLSNNIIGHFPCSEDAAKDLKIKPATAKAAAERGSLVKHQYRIKYDFPPSQRKTSDKNLTEKAG